MIIRPRHHRVSELSNETVSLILVLISCIEKRPRDLYEVSDKGTEEEEEPAAKKARFEAESGYIADILKARWQKFGIYSRRPWGKTFHALPSFF